MHNAELQQYNGLVDTIRIDHLCYVRALKSMGSALKSVGVSATPICLHIIGDTRTGKSTVIDDFVAQHAASRAAEGSRQTVVYGKVPPKGTVIGLLENLLRALGDPLWHKGTETNKTHRLETLLRAVGCRMIILDEFQHLCDKRQNVRLRQTSDWLKILVDGREWALVAVGLPESASVIQSNGQLRDRFDAPIRLAKFDWREKSSRTQFKAVLVAFQQQLAPFELPVLGEDDLAMRMFLATAGRIGILAKILDRAVRNAIERDSTKIRIDDLALAFREAVWYADQFPMPEGPFGAEFGAIVTDSTYETVMAIASQDSYADKSGHVAILMSQEVSHSGEMPQPEAKAKRQRRRNQVGNALGGSL
jgi:hypothetical protein